MIMQPPQLDTSALEGISNLELWMVNHMSASGRDLAVDIEDMLLNIGIAYWDKQFQGFDIIIFLRAA